MLDPDSQAIVNGIIRGAPVENALRIAGKAHAWLGAMFGHQIAGLIGAVGLPMASTAARWASARQTFGRVNRLAGKVSGTTQIKRAPGSAPLAPLAVFYGLAAQRAANQAKQGGQQTAQ